MNRLSFSLLVVLLVSVGVAAAQDEPKKAVIAGIVSQVGTSAPIPGALVVLVRQGLGAAREFVPLRTARGDDAAPPIPDIPSVMTGEDGRFAFQDVDEGGYIVRVLANGHVGQSYGQRYAGGPGTPIHVTAGQEIKDVAVRLTPAGSISGRILDTADEPLINVPVKVYRYSYDESGRRTYELADDTVTDDRGEYRIYWLTPGRYYLMAGRPSSGLDPMTALLETMMRSDFMFINANIPAVPLNYAYYPGVTEVAEARPIEVLPGAEVSGMDLRLARKPRTFRVRGRLMDPRTGQPPRLASVTILPQSLGAKRGGGAWGMSPVPRQDYNVATGFDFNDLLPGIYVVWATVEEPPADRVAGGRGADGEFVRPQMLTGSVTVAVSSENIDGLVINVVPGVAIPGQIRVEGPLLPAMNMSRMHVFLTPASPTGIESPLQPSSVAKSDGSFRLENVAPGDYRVRVTAFGVFSDPAGAGRPAPSTYMKDARFEGGDGLNVPLHISGAVSGSLDIVMGVGGGMVTGIVTDARLKPVAVTQVTIIPTRYRDRPDLYTTVTTDENGRFIITNIPPGDYKVFSWESVEPFGWFDPELMSASEVGGRPVRVTEGAVETIEVRLVPAGGTR